MHDHSAAEKTRSLLLQTVLVGTVVLGALTIFDAVSSATEPVADTLETDVDEGP